VIAALFAILGILILAALYLVIDSTPKVEGEVRNPVFLDYSKAGEIPGKSPDLDSIKTRTQGRARLQETMELEVHPLEQIALLKDKVDRYIEAARKKVLDEELGKFNASAERFSFSMQTFEVDDIIEEVQNFAPIQTSYHFSLEVELVSVAKMVSKDVYDLAQYPSRVHGLAYKAASLNNFKSGLYDLISEYNTLHKKEIGSDVVKELVSNSMGIVSSEELWEQELNELLNFAYGLKSYLLLKPFQESLFDEITRETQKLVAGIENAKTILSQDLTVNLQTIQRNLLPLYRSFYTHYMKLYQGMFTGLERLQASNLTQVQENSDLLDQLLDELESDLIVASSNFAESHGRFDQDYHNLFSKILGSRGNVGIGVAETSISFFESRLREGKQMVHSPLLGQVDDLLNQLFSKIKDA